MKKEIFKAYDIRGIYPNEISAEDVNLIAKSYAAWLRPKKVALGMDVRISGPELWQAAADGLTEMGVDVVDLGVISTDMLYFAVANYGLSGGITISASHNAGEYNGMKLVREGARPISIDTGLAEIRDLAFAGVFVPAPTKGKIEKLDFLKDYVEMMVSFAGDGIKRPLSVVANTNFGAAGKAVSLISKKLNIEILPLNFEEDGNFPKGKPDPMQAANRIETEALISGSAVDFGVTWDADADRCFFYDERGNFILPYYTTALLLDHLLDGKTGETVIIDPRLRWLLSEIIKSHGSNVVINKAGHSFIKERMREVGALFAAETSAHYYFKGLWYTDNGMVPFILMLKIVSESNMPLSEMIKKFQSRVSVIEETNFTVDDVEETIGLIKEKYSGGKEDEIDGFSTEFEDWRMNLRGSNTEPVIRLNIESFDKNRAKEKLEEISELISG